MITERQILEKIAQILRVSVQQIRSKDRHLRIMEARCLAIYFIRLNRPDVAWRSISRIFKRDHSTAIHAVRCVERWREVDDAFRHRYEICAMQLGISIPVINKSLINQKKRK